MCIAIQKKKLFVQKWVKIIILTVGAVISGVARGHAGHAEHDQKFPPKLQIKFFRNSTSNLLVFRNLFVRNFRYILLVLAKYSLFA